MSGYQSERDVVDVINVCEVFCMPKKDRIKLLIKCIVMYQYDDHENCIDTSSVEHSSNNSLMGYYRQCVSEVQRMKTDKMCRNFTLFDFVSKGNSLDTGLTDEDFMCVCRHRSRNIQYFIYPIYEDMVLEKATRTFMRISGRSDCVLLSLYIREWEDIFQGKTVMLRLGKCDSVSVTDNNTGVCKIYDFEDAFPNWEDLKSHYVGEAKLVLQETLFSETELLEYPYNAVYQYRAFNCYPFLKSFYNAFICEIRMMLKDKISYKSVRRTFLHSYHRKLVKIIPINDLGDVGCFKMLLEQKYILYMDTVARGIIRSFLSDIVVDRCISIEVPNNSNKNTAKKHIILFPHVFRKVCDFLSQADLLNLVLAYCVPYIPRKRKNNVAVAHCKRLTRSKKYL